MMGKCIGEETIMGNYGANYGEMQCWQGEMMQVKRLHQFMISCGCIVAKTQKHCFIIVIL